MWDPPNLTSKQHRGLPALPVSLFSLIDFAIASCIAFFGVYLLAVAVVVIMSPSPTSLPSLSKQESSISSSPDFETQLTVIATHHCEVLRREAPPNRSLHFSEDFVRLVDVRRRVFEARETWT